MCTLTYMPTRQGFIFTHTRDESPGRPASKKLQERSTKSGKMYFPQDLEARGTWMALGNNRAACLLNGGSKAYDRKAKYELSRGNIIPSLFEHDSTQAFYAQHNFAPYEPFTLIVREGHDLFQLIHDLDQNELIVHNYKELNIWSSTKLYTPEVRKKRQEQFYNWLAQKPKPAAAEIKDFHLRGQENADGPGFRIKVQGLIETVSLTQIEVAPNSASIFYQRLPGMESDFVQV